MSPHARTHARTHTRALARDLARLAQMARLITAGATCRTGASSATGATAATVPTGIRTYLMRSWHSCRDWRDSHWRSYVRSRVRSVRHYVFSCAPIRRLAAAVHYVPQSAPAPITPNSAATVHYVLAATELLVGTQRRLCHWHHHARRHARTGCSHVLTRARRCTRTGTLTRTGSSHVLWPTSWPKLSPDPSCLRLCLLACNLLALLVRWSPILGVVAHAQNRFRCRRGHAVARAARSRRRP